MLQMYNVPGGRICYKIGTRHINDQLIGLMESHMAWGETKGDINALRNNRAFAEECVLSLTPENCDPEGALNSFFSLYDLLKAEKMYKPNLLMEYILFQIIQIEIDLTMDDREANSLIEKIPEENRKKMLKEVEKLIKNGKYDDLPDPSAEEEVSRFEDIQAYMDICFEDFDCLFLDQMTERELEERGLAKAFGINTTSRIPPGGWKN